MNVARILGWLPILTSGALLAGCPAPVDEGDAGMASPDAVMSGDDAFTAEMPDAVATPDAFLPEDAFVGTDTAVPPLPPIADPTAHLVPASADGHDRFFGVTFAPDSSFYVVGVRAAGTDALTNDFETIVGHFLASGELDASFGTAGWFSRNLTVGLGGETARGIALDAEGRIVVAATVEHVASGADARDRDVAVLRLTSAGALDTTFGTDGIAVLDLSDGEAAPPPATTYAADSAWNVVIDGMGRILVAVGPKRTGGTDTDFGIVRLTPAGALDTTFATGGLFTLDIANANASVREIQLEAGGRIAGAGYYSDAGSVRPVLYMVDDAGALVDSFGTGGVYTEVVLTAQTEIYGFAVQGTSFVTSGYGRELGPADNDFISLRIDATTGVRDLTYGGGDGVALLEGFDFSDSARDLVLLPDGRSMMLGALRTATSAADAALVLLTRDGEADASFGTAGVSLHNLADGTVDAFWSGDIDPRGERVVVVGIGGTSPATDDDGLVYLLPVP